MWVLNFDSVHRSVTERTRKRQRDVNDNQAERNYIGINSNVFIVVVSSIWDTSTHSTHPLLFDLHKLPVAHSNYWTVRHRLASSIRSIEWKSFWLATIHRMANFYSAYSDWLQYTAKLVSGPCLHFWRVTKKKQRKIKNDNLKCSNALQTLNSKRIYICISFKWHSLLLFFPAKFTHSSSNNW